MFARYMPASQTSSDLRGGCTYGVWGWGRDLQTGSTRLPERSDSVAPARPNHQTRRIPGHECSRARSRTPPGNLDAEDREDDRAGSGAGRGAPIITLVLRPGLVANRRRFRPLPRRHARARQRLGHRGNNRLGGPWEGQPVEGWQSVQHTLSRLHISDSTQVPQAQRCRPARGAVCVSVCDTRIPVCTVLYTHRASVPARKCFRKGQKGRQQEWCKWSHQGARARQELAKVSDR